MMIGNSKELIQWLLDQDKRKLFEIKEHKEKRSLNANSYAWALIGKIADAVRASKDDVYMLMLKRYGQSQMISVVASADITGFFKYWEKIGETFLQGKLFNHYRIFKGSSEYDSGEMAILIDGIISEAKELGIETLPPAEIERMKHRWNPS